MLRLRRTATAVGLGVVMGSNSKGGFDLFLGAGLVVVPLTAPVALQGLQRIAQAIASKRAAASPPATPLSPVRRHTVSGAYGLWVAKQNLRGYSGWKLSHNERYIKEWQIEWSQNYLRRYKQPEGVKLRSGGHV